MVEAYLAGEGGLKGLATKAGVDHSLVHYWLKQYHAGELSLDLLREEESEPTEADYRVTGISLNGHPMRHLRPSLQPNGVRTARDLQANGRDTEQVAIAGLVICRQRPGPAKGFVFLFIEDETGIVNVVVTTQRFKRDALKISTSPLLLVRGTLQVESNVVTLRGRLFVPLVAQIGAEHVRSHDFR